MMEHVETLESDPRTGGLLTVDHVLCPAGAVERAALERAHGGGWVEVPFPSSGLVLFKRLVPYPAQCLPRAITGPEDAMPPG